MACGNFLAGLSWQSDFEPVIIKVLKSWKGIEMNSTPRKISKSTFYARGGLANPNQYRKQVGNDWQYFTYERWKGESTMHCEIMEFLARDFQSWYIVEIIWKV